MRKIVPPQRVRQMDKEAIEAGTPGIELMRRAARALAAEVMARAPGRSIVILCGPGNNGGDGMMAANLLLEGGFEPQIILLADRESLRGDAAWALSQVHPAIAVHRGIQDFSYSLVVDALLGTGLDRTVEGEMAQAIEWINSLDLPVISADIPSGVDGRTGQVMGCAVKADVTVTFAVEKPGLVFYPGKALAGLVVVADIGLRTPEDGWIALSARGIGAMLPRRRPNSFKNDYGHLAVAAGSPHMMGAGALCSAAALRTGAGLVSWAFREGGAPRGLWEVMTFPVPKADEQGALAEFFAGKNAIALGPGLGENALPWVEEALKTKLPLVMDADGLNALKGQPERLKGAQGVITPHPGEAGRLLDRSSRQIAADPVGAALELARRSGFVAVVKGAVTVIADDLGQVALNTAGNPGMATAGSGDVLTGIVGSLLAQGLSPWQAACAGVHLHALAGDQAAQGGMAGMIASDMIKALPGVIALLTGEERT